MACSEYFKSIRTDKNDIHNPSVRTVFSESMSVSLSSQLEELGLTDNLWKTYRVNALYDFSYDDEKFNEYHLSLISYVKKELSQNMIKLPVNFSKYIVSINKQNSTVFAGGDHPGVKISIVNEDDECSMPCFTGFLLSVERKNGFMEMSRKRAQAVVLPLMLVDYADERFLNCVISFLKDNFHCHIWPLKFTSSDLIWMLALSTCTEDKKSSASILEYELPMEELSSIKYCIDPRSMNETSQQFLKLESQNEISDKEVAMFYSELKLHFRSIFSIDLSHLNITVIKTPLARIHGDHSIFIFEKKYLFPILRHLTHLAQEIR